MLLVRNLYTKLNRHELNAHDITYPLCFHETAPAVQQALQRNKHLLLLLLLDVGTEEKKNYIHIESDKFKMVAIIH